MNSLTTIEYIEYIGIVSFALSGFYVAIKDRLDLLGIFISSFLTALGGGITRDALSNRMPYTFTHLEPGLLVIGTIIVAVLLKLHKNSKVEQNFLFILSDTLGLSSFSITASMVGINVGFNYFGVVLLALITGVGGGVCRDILLNKVPVLLSTGLYGTISLVVGSLMYFAHVFGLINPYSLMGIFLFGVVFRQVAYYRNWNLPVLKQDIW